MRVGRDRGEVRREEARVLSINLTGVVVCTNLKHKGGGEKKYQKIYRKSGASLCEKKWPNRVVAIRPNWTTWQIVGLGLRTGWCCDYHSFRPKKA